MWQCGGVVKLICFLRRKDGLSAEEFHRYWREQHGPLVASTKSGSHVVRYEQNHRAPSDYRRPAPPGLPDYDGVTEQWFRSVEDFYASIAEEDYQLIADDVDKFIDTESLLFLLTEEPEVVIDGDASHR